MIGKAGENLVRFAGVCSDLSHFHGRSGMGAVMGSKNLKGVACKGSQKIEFADPEKIKELAKWFADNFKNNVDNATHIKYGTNQYYWNANHAALPTYNFKDGHFEPLEHVTIEDYQERFKVGAEGCYACPVRCKQVLENKEEGYYNIQKRYGGPEFETLGIYGSACGMADLMAPAKGHEVCNRYGMDTISSGLTLAFAMECYRERTDHKRGYGRDRAQVWQYGRDVPDAGEDRQPRRIWKHTGRGQQKGGRDHRQRLHQVFHAGKRAGVCGGGTARQSSAWRFSTPYRRQGQTISRPSTTAHLTRILQDTATARTIRSGMIKNLFPMGILEPVKSLYLGPEKVQAGHIPAALTGACSTLWSFAYSRSGR